MSGGARKGAGRKPARPELKKIPLGLKLPRWLVEWMREQPKSQAVLVEEALKEVHNLTTPQFKTKETICPLIDAVNLSQSSKRK